MNEEEKSKKLDETLAFLAKKGMATIAQDTKLSNPKIKAILEKDFDSVQRVHAVGFVQILEKEYGVDLSQWLVEYDQNLFGIKRESGLSKEPQRSQEPHKQKHTPKTESAKQQSQEPPKVQEQEQAKEQPEKLEQTKESQAQEQAKESKKPSSKSKVPEKPQEPKRQEQPPKEKPECTQEYVSPFLDNKKVGEPTPPTPESKKSKSFLVLPVVLVVGLGVFFFINHYKDSKDQEDTTTQEQKISPSSDVESKAKEPQAALTASKDEQPAPTSSTPKDSNLKDPDQAKTEATPKPQESKALQSALKTPTAPTSLKTAQATTPPTDAPKQATEYPKIVITPTKGALWVETIDLKTKHKSQTTITEPFSLDTQGHRWLLAFGNGHLSIEAEGKRMDFNRDRSVRLLYTPKRGFVRLSLAHYQERSQ
ncbi:hypothetical protein [Helicobacter heilmannii]|uniref:hypothetical protein n=1 Tax=Helicobacter heilmannii TaxID=35817 RepID=UPI0006A0BB7C|nr:hypothetical protein [Helicobacter heilmannii]CRF45548.1 hypothetical protein HHE014_05120 [Helicobacter heilmannii]